MLRAQIVMRFMPINYPKLAVGRYASVEKRKEKHRIS